MKEKMEKFQQQAPTINTTNNQVSYINFITGHFKPPQ